MNHESRVVSALLKNNDYASVMGDNIVDMMDSHKDIMQFVIDYQEQNSELPPPQLVVEEFPSTFDFHGEIAGATRHHLEALKEFRRKQIMAETLSGALNSVTNGTQKTVDVINHLNKRMSSLERTTGLSRAIDIRDADEANEHYRKVREMAKLHGGRPGIQTGFKTMDDNYPTGLASGHFFILMGYSGLGKTWFAIKMAINAWEQGFSVLMINLEMSQEELRDRIYFLISHYTMDDLVKAEIDPDTFNAWVSDFMTGKAPFNIVSPEGGDGFTTAMVQAKIDQFKPDLVVCDYMQLFYDKNMTQQDTARAKNASTEFKRVAINTKTPIILISAVTGKDKKDRDNPPDIAQLAWSSQLEYDANMCIAVHTHRNKVTQKAESSEVVCRKNRHGPLFSFRVKMDLDNGVIEEIEASEQVRLMFEEGKDLDAIFGEEKELASEIKSIQEEQLGS